MSRISCFLVLLLVINVSCQKDDLTNNFPANVSFEISGRFLEGRQINCIDIDRQGNAFIGSGSELYCIKGSGQDSYKLDFQILDLAIAPDQTLWIGTNGGGLGHFTGRDFTWYTNTNAGLPRDYVRNVEIAPDGDVFFTSCAYRLGGLGIYNGKKFEFLTPENSPLNQNIIEDIEIDQDGIVYIATTGKVGRTNIYRITDRSWKCLGDEEGTFYWIFSFTIGPSGVIYLVEDFSLSSAFNTNKLFRYVDDEWQNIDMGDIQPIRYFTRIKADRRNYCWLAGHLENSALLHVFNGKSWVSSPEGLFPDDIITAIEADSNNNMWVGTYNNGVFILKQ